MSALAEYTLVTMARLLSRSELAHSTEMKTALRDPSTFQRYRAREFERVRDAAARYQVPIAGRVVLDVGCNDGALTSELTRLGAREVIGVDVDAGAIERALASPRLRCVFWSAPSIGCRYQMPA